MTLVIGGMVNTNSHLAVISEFVIHNSTIFFLKKILYFENIKPESLWPAFSKEIFSFQLKHML